MMHAKYKSSRSYSFGDYFFKISIYKTMQNHLLPWQESFWTQVKHLNSFRKDELDNVSSCKIYKLLGLLM